MTTRPHTRERMLDSATTLLQRRGLAAMSFTEVLEASGAARGAIYHHFPGGKEQLAREAVTRHGADVRTGLAQLPDHDAHALVEAFFAAVRPVLAASAGGSGCAVAAVTVDIGAGSATHLEQVAGEVFDSWRGELIGKLERAGLDALSADEIATLLLTLLQGAHVMCRAAGSLDPLDRAQAAVLRSLDQMSRQLSQADSGTSPARISKGKARQATQ